MLLVMTIKIWLSLVSVSNLSRSEPWARAKITFKWANMSYLRYMWNPWCIRFSGYLIWEIVVAKSIIVMDIFHVLYKQATIALSESGVLLFYWCKRKLYFFSTTSHMTLCGNMYTKPRVFITHVGWCLA